jgi:hypothetical protein
MNVNSPWTYLAKNEAELSGIIMEINDLCEFAPDLIDQAQPQTTIIFSPFCR